MKRILLPLLLFAAALPAGAGNSHLVGQWTFSGANPLEAKIGADAVTAPGTQTFDRTSGRAMGDREYFRIPLQACRAGGLPNTERTK